jgi:hypothetical protein
MVLSRVSTGIAGLFIGAVVAGGVSVASIPSSSGTLSACMNKKNGQIRMIDAEAGKKCGAGQKLLTWNRQGPAGKRGPAGEDGADGKIVTYGAGQVDDGRTLQSGEQTTLTRFQAPLGGYLAFIHVRAITNGESGRLTCTLGYGSGAFSFDEASIDFFGTGRRQSLYMTTTFGSNPDNNETQQLTCRWGGSDSVTIEAWNFLGQKLEGGAAWPPVPDNAIDGRQESPDRI